MSPNFIELNPLNVAKERWIRAYLPILQNPLAVIHGQLHASELIDMAEVALASKQIGVNSFYPVIEMAINMSEGKRLFSIGAGTCELLIRFLLNDQNRTGIALERTPESCRLARQRAKEAGVSKRLEIINKDAIEILENESILDGVHIVEAAFLIHDILNQRGEDLTVKLLETVALHLPDKGSFLIAEANRARANADWFSRIFTVVHEIQGISLPSVQEWGKIFRKAGLEIRETIDARMPGSTLYNLGKISGCKADEVPVKLGIEGHKNLVPFYMHSRTHRVPVSIAAVDLGMIPSDGPAHPHRHDVDEFYMLPDYSPPVRISVTVEGKTREITSPALLQIFAGAVHSFRILQAEKGQHIFGVFVEEAA